VAWAEGFERFAHRLEQEVGADASARPVPRLQRRVKIDTPAQLLPPALPPPPRRAEYAD
jgi:hypothetical protein